VRECPEHDVASMRAEATAARDATYAALVRFFLAVVGGKALGRTERARDAVGLSAYLDDLGDRGNAPLAVEFRV